MTLPVEHDAGEQILRGTETASGERSPGCPWRQMRDPFVVAVMRAHRWWKTGELGTRWGGEIPEALARGIECFDGAINAVQAHDMREEREEREREQRRRELERSVRGGMPRGRR